MILEDEYQLPPSRIEKELKFMHLCSFLSKERVPLPSKTNTTDFLLELNNILKDNTTLEEIVEEVHSLIVYKHWNHT